MRTRQAFIVIALFGVSAVCAEEYVEKADVNGDGFVSLYELRAAHYADPEFNKRIEQMFDRYDRNGDGLISGDERRARRGTTEAASVSTPAENRYIDSDAAVSAAAAREGIEAAEQRNAQPVVEETLDDGRNRNNAGKRTTQTPTGQDSLRPDTRRADTARRDNADADRGATSGRGTWLSEIDTDYSGGASVAELIANGDGQQWFRVAEFNAADRNGNGELDETELAALVSMLERRHR